MDGIIGMDEISKVLDVADELGFNREQIRVELTKEDPGVVEIVQGGNLSSFQEIVNILKSTPMIELKDNKELSYGPWPSQSIKLWYDKYIK